ncbi:beta-lactamase-like protein [Multifurca ochricompacta]|uniref:Cleavage and polyadenylation specificity factor subunit 2 n=1 Tax=Multifurca ochricompacta TaxID=376703 RepID=A0AAD4MB10_9AGAM|nr:beta-lactamase-like protein [Multifurca ochricompacta]
MLTFTPLSGAAKSSRTSPLAYLLQVDDIKILLDCGSPDWCPEQEEPQPSSTEDRNNATENTFHWEQYCDKLREIAPSVDLVLLSHGDLAHSGLYPYAYSRWGLKAPAYSTLPVQSMARIAATEEAEGIRDEENVSGTEEQETPADGDDELMQDGSNVSPESQPEVGSSFRHSSKYVATAQEIHDSFDAVNTLRYSQPAHLSGRCQGLTVTPFNAGHTLGGTIWKIRSPSVGTIVYAVDINHMRERHLDGTVLMRGAGGGVFESLARPDLLITDAERANAIGSRRKDRDVALIDTIATTLSSRSSLLLPCDASTRVLELLVLLDQHWSSARLKFPICLLSRTGREMLTFVRSMMEWLGGTVSKEDVGEDTSGKRNNKRRREEDADEDAIGAFALRFKHLEFFPSPQVLLQTYSSKDPKLILAVPASLSHGPSRLLFADFAAVPDNVILLTGRGEEGTLGRKLFERWNNSQRAEDKWDKGKLGSNVMLDGSLSLRLNSKVPLTGVELEIFQQKQRLAREKAAVAQAALARNQQLLEADEGADSSDSDSDAADEEDVERALGLDTEVTRTDGADWGRGMDMEESGRQMLSFDIYLKGNVSRAASFFKSAGKENQRFRMFPYIEKKRRVDEYGEVIDVAMWVRRGKIMEEEAEDEEGMGRKRQEEEAKVTEEVPSKYVSMVVEVQLACRLLFVDLEGLNDGRAAKTIIPKVAPRKLIIVHGGPAATDSLLESCANIRAMTKDIYAPAEGESIQIGQNTNSYSISLSDEMLASVRMSRFEDNEVGFVMGRLTTSASSTMPVLEPSNQNTLATSGPSPALPPVLGGRSTQRLPHSTMIGELKLTALKARLAAVGVQAELIGEGVLVCRGGDVETVAVRKSARGHVELEGTVCDVYYKVRREIYGLHALVSA